MSLTKISGASVYYLEEGEVHGDIASPVRGDLAIYTYAPAGGFMGQEYSYSGTVWFARNQIAKAADDSVAMQSIITESSLTEGTLAEMITNAGTLSPKNKGKRWQATDDSDRIYSYSFAGGAWAYYPEINPALAANGDTALLSVVADLNQTSSNFAGLKIVGAAGFAYAFAENVKTLVLKVTHATQTIQVGQGETADEALLNADLQIAFDINDSIQKVGRKGDLPFYALKASNSATTVYVTQN